MSCISQLGFLTKATTGILARLLCICDYLASWKRTVDTVRVHLACNVESPDDPSAISYSNLSASLCDRIQSQRMRTVSYTDANRLPKHFLFITSKVLLGILITTRCRRHLANVHAGGAPLKRRSNDVNEVDRGVTDCLQRRRRRTELSTTTSWQPIAVTRKIVEKRRTLVRTRIVVTTINAIIYLS